MNILHEKTGTPAAKTKSGVRYDTITEASRDAIIVVQDEYVTYFNRVALEMTKYAPDEITGKWLGELIHPEDRTMVLDRLHKRLEGEEIPHVYPFRVLRKDGSTLWVENNAVIIDWEGQPVTLTFLRDVTERMRAEDERARAMADLQNRLREIEKLNEFMVGREKRIIELKREVNALLKQLGREAKYAG